MLKLNSIFNGKRKRKITDWISSNFFSFFVIVEIADSFLSSNILVPAASSIIERVSGGFIFKTFVILPCIIKKWGLLTFNWTDWKRFETAFWGTLWPLIKYLFLPLITIYYL